MKCVSGTFNGTGAALFVLCGFVPDKVVVRAVGDAGNLSPSLVWTKNDRVAAHVEGVLDTDGATQLVDEPAGSGICIYEGGELLTAAMQTSTGYGEGVYLIKDDKDYRYGTDAQPGGGSGDAVSTTIDTWTLDTSGDRTGSFNEDVTGAYIGAGSRILLDNANGNVKQKWAVIEALTAGQGEADDEVTLNRAIESGVVRFISGKYDLAPLAVGLRTPAGFKLNMTANVNEFDELQTFEAYLFDD